MRNDSTGLAQRRTRTRLRLPFIIDVLAEGGLATYDLVRLFGERYIRDDLRKLFEDGVVTRRRCRDVFRREDLRDLKLAPYEWFWELADGS